MVSEIDNETKCFSCGKEATIRLTVEHDGGSLYLCDDRDCKEEALIQLDDVDFDYQGKKPYQVEFSETVSAVSMIIIIAGLFGMLIYKFINL